MSVTALRSCLWDASGQRRLPSEAALIAAIDKCKGDELWRVCELSAPGPVYLLPTTGWIKLLHKQLLALGAKRVLEVAAGDGFLTQSLAKLKPSYALHATDSGAWVSPQKRMSKADQAEFAHIDVPGLRLGTHVQRLGAVAAVKRYKPDVVLVSWAPPGLLVEQMIRLRVKHVLDISVDGDVCGNGMRTWRFEKEFLDGPLERRALCRLDRKPRRERHTRVTLYFGR